uniref:Uncharacterized protein n=1 Tax=Setaria viridis TaxID=4556 RepID=A0A4U6V8P0_SETVI|nr:hypothetical protein SEVIR_3G127050v2 [Setaria viridis]
MERGSSRSRSRSGRAGEAYVLVQPSRVRTSR